MMRQPRIELRAQRWQRWILPLNHWRLFTMCLQWVLVLRRQRVRELCMVLVALGGNDLDAASAGYA